MHGGGLAVGEFEIGTGWIAGR